jgi:serine/threonine protein kinase
MNQNNSSEPRKVPSRPLQIINGMAIAASLGKNSKEFNMIHDAAELETSGLQNKQIHGKSGLPDGSRPITLGSGTVSGILGEGGAAVLYEIRNKDLGFQRAVKLLRPNHNNESLERFLKEFKVCAQLTHPNIPVVHTVGQWHGLPYIEMEKVTGFSLSEMIAKFAPVPTGLVTAIGIIMCKALEYIHNCKYEIDKKDFKGILHLDLKPSNIMLSHAGVLKIMDFGMATPVQEAREGHFPGSSLGSSQYVAPEIIFSRSAPDARSDLFSLGCILFELATGTRVFTGKTMSEVMSARKNHSIPSLRKLDRSLPEPFIKLIEKCLQFEKESRPETAVSIRHSLEKIHRTQTGINAEDVILLYVTKRKSNEPFELPPVIKNSHAMVLYAAGIAGAVCLGILTVLLVWKPENIKATTSSLSNRLTTIIPDKSTDKQVPIMITEPQNTFSVSSETKENTTNSQDPVATPTPAVGDFYESDANPEQTQLLDSLRHKWSSRKFDELRTFIDNLPIEVAKNKEVILYKLRSMGRDNNELGKTINANVINDGEYFFHKARYLTGESEYKAALECLAKAESQPSEFIDKRVLGTEVQLYRSRNLTSLFRDNPTAENLQNALNAWDKLLLIVKDRPTSIQAKEAEKEKKNLAAEATWRGIN